MVKLELSNQEIKNLTNDEIEIAKARKLELLVLPHIRRNVNFFYAGANIPKKAKAYNEPMKKEELEKAVEGKRKPVPTVCKPLCEMISTILKENGINAETVSCDTDMFRHTDVLLTTSSGKQYIINYLEDLENVQTKMSTPDFASKAYYERRYKKFENGVTTDGKSLSKINFLTNEQLDKIDTNLGYKKYGLYMDQVIEQIKDEFANFREVMAENEYLTELRKLEKLKNDITKDEKEKLKEKIYFKYQAMSNEEVLEGKLDWIFNYFNTRMDISGHTDFVMYYSQLLLKQVLSPKEYNKITRYDCFLKEKDIPNKTPLKEILDFNNKEDESKIRFCLLKLGETTYAFSTKPNVYKKFSKEEMKDIKKYVKISKSQKPSELVLKLCDRGNALPLIFHPLGSKILNERADMIDKSLSDEEKHLEIDRLAASIKTTDGDITSITIPYPTGEEKYIYINKNNEFVVSSKDKTIIYHYDEENDKFNKELIENDIER